MNYKSNGTTKTELFMIIFHREKTLTVINRNPIQDFSGVLYPPLSTNRWTTTTNTEIAICLEVIDVIDRPSSIPSVIDSWPVFTFYICCKQQKIFLVFSVGIKWELWVKGMSDWNEWNEWDPERFSLFHFPSDFWNHSTKIYINDIGFHLLKFYAH